MSNCCKENKDKCCGIGFHSIPAALGDDTGEFKPENGAYHNMLVKYEENGAIYLYTNDGVPIKISGECCPDSLSFTMRYTAVGPSSTILPGWIPSELMEKVKTPNEDPTRPIYKSVRRYTSSAEYPVTFLNDKTNEVLTPGGLYNLLISGEDIVINHVPLGFVVCGESASAGSYVDGVRLTKYIDSDPYNIVGFGGSVFSENTTCSDDSGLVQTQLGFTISGSINGGSATYEQMTIQGFETVDE